MKLCVKLESIGEKLTLRYHLVEDNDRKMILFMISHRRAYQIGRNIEYLLSPFVYL